MQRLENKYLIRSELEKNKFLKFIILNKGYEIHQRRTINSIYFDSSGFKLFDYSEEGLATRNKIRLRFYGEVLNLNELNIEVKESHPYTKKKYVSNFLDNKICLSKNIVDAKNLILNRNVQPKVKVTYDRRYFFSDECGRFTIDENITYEKADWNVFLKSFRFYCKIRETRSVCEHKLENNNFIKETFSIPNTRFSKYCEAVKSIYKI